MSFKQILLAGAIVVFSASAAVAACKQSQLGAPGAPKKWGIYANGQDANDNVVSFTCEFAVRAYNDVRGFCFASGVAQAGTTKASWIKLSDGCKLTFRLETAKMVVRDRGDGKFGAGLVGGVAASGTASMIKPWRAEIYHYKMWQLHL